MSFTPNITMNVKAGWHRIGADCKAAYISASPCVKLPGGRRGTGEVLNTEYLVTGLFAKSPLIIDKPNAFAKTIRTSASTPTGAEHFPYGYSVSLKTLLTMMRDRLELEEVSMMGDELVVLASEPDLDSDEEENPDGFVVWMFVIPACDCALRQRVVEALGWFKAVRK